MLKKLTGEVYTDWDRKDLTLEGAKAKKGFMLKFDKALQAWGASDFEEVLKQEIAQLDAGQLPLQQGLAISNVVTADPISVINLRVTELDNVIRVRAGILYKGMIGGCSCTDDPTPDNTNNEYCEVQLDIDKVTAITTVASVEATN